jgi:hypothetical protein
LNVMPTQHKFWHNGKTMDASTLSQFGLTLKLLTAGHGEELLTSFLAAFHARTLAPQERGPALTANEAVYGDTWPGLLAKFDLPTSSWRTAQLSLVEGLDEFSETWPRWGSMRNGVCWARQEPDSRTAENASGSLLPTPSGVNAGRNHTMGRVDEWGGQQQPFAWDRHWLDVFTGVRGTGNGLARNVDRTDAIRNGQVPRVAATAFLELASRFE